jgi:hypothetical protein
MAIIAVIGCICCILLIGVAVYMLVLRKPSTNGDSAPIVGATTADSSGGYSQAGQPAQLYGARVESSDYSTPPAPQSLYTH